MLASASVTAASTFACKVLDHVRARDESHAHTHGNKSLQQLAGVEFHRDRRLQPALVEDRFQRIARAPQLGQQQRKLEDFRDRGFLAVRPADGRAA